MLVERKSPYTVIRTVHNRTIKAARNTAIDGFAPHIDWVRTITYDKRREFTDHEGMATDLDTQIYFAHPYVSWKHGLNEKTNGLNGSTSRNTWT